jgi:large subunit ribosomal protein L23
MISKIITLTPIITEKSLALRKTESKYTFLVGTKVNKNQITAAFETVFTVKPLKINTVLIKGKVKTNWKTHKSSQRSNRKKAIITVPKGTKLELLKLKTK